MYDRAGAASIAGVAVWIAAMATATLPALAEPARLALVVGNGGYATLPALPACLQSARDLTAALRGLGFQAIGREDASSGALAGAIGELSDAMARAPGASVLVYVCGYAAGMNDRPFLLPASARIARPSDVMTQGILAKALLDAVARGNPSRGVLALDLAPAPNLPAPPLDGLAELPLPEGLGLVALTAPQPASGPTDLGAALASGVAAPGTGTAELLADLKTRLADRPGTRIAALRLPRVSRALALDDAPAPAAALPEAPVAAAPLAPDPRDTQPRATLPDEAAMSDAERRRVQAALGTLGYYSDRIDGRFGPETRAAIRRYQHEIGVEMTGTLTGAQATELVEGR